MKKLIIIMLLLLFFQYLNASQHELNIMMALYIIDDDCYIFHGYVIINNIIIPATVGSVKLYLYERKWIKNRTYKIIIIKRNNEVFSIIRFSFEKNVKIIIMTREEFFNLAQNKNLIN